MEDISRCLKNNSNQGERLDEGQMVYIDALGSATQSTKKIIHHHHYKCHLKTTSL